MAVPNSAKAGPLVLLLFFLRNYYVLFLTAVNEHKRLGLGSRRCSQAQPWGRVKLSDQRGAEAMRP